MKKTVTTVCETTYLIVGAAAMIEFLWVQGAVTSRLMMAAVMAVGAANLLLACQEKDWKKALLYLLCSAALCLGPLTLIGR